jgi:hypothetical protein
MVESLPDNFFALILPCQYNYLMRGGFATKISDFGMIRDRMNRMDRDRINRINRMSRNGTEGRGVF